jgi:hypothetical protein
MNETLYVSGGTFVGYCNFFRPLLTFPLLNVRWESFAPYDMSEKLYSTFKACWTFFFSVFFSSLVPRFITLRSKSKLKDCVDFSHSVLFWLCVCVLVDFIFLSIFSIFFLLFFLCFISYFFYLLQHRLCG